MNKSKEGVYRLKDRESHLLDQGGSGGQADEGTERQREYNEGRRREARVWLCKLRVGLCMCESGQC